MDQNQQTLDSDLQKAIDDITKTTSVDPVFSDPVAAPSSVPEGDDGSLGEAIGPFPEPQPEVPTPAPAPMPEMMPTMEVPEVAQPETEYYETPVMPEPEEVVAEPEPLNEAPAAAPELSMRQVKEAALRDLAPLLGKMNISATQKFRIYRDMFESLRDYTVLESAYHAASEIANEDEKAKALLYLVEAIDRM